MKLFARLSIIDHMVFAMSRCALMSLGSNSRAFLKYHIASLNILFVSPIGFISLNACHF
jgi:hypothetical protein